MKFPMEKSKFKWLAILAVAVVIGLVWLGLSRRSSGQATAPNDAGTLPTVAVSKVTRQDIFKQVTIPAEFRPYEEAMLNAKVSGYVSKMNVDFGDTVKAGQLMATLEVPEL